MAGWNTCLQWQTHWCTQIWHTHLVPKGICPQPKSSQLLRKNSSISSVKELTKSIYTCAQTHTCHPHSYTHIFRGTLILSQSVALIGVLMILWECGILQATVEWLPALYFSFKVEIHPQTGGCNRQQTHPANYTPPDTFLLRFSSYIFGYNPISFFFVPLACDNTFAKIKKITHMQVYSAALKSEHSSAINI